MQPVETCDLCGSNDLQEVADAGSGRCRTVMCRNCGLFFASPSLAREVLEAFYDDEFEGDAGTNARAGGGIEARKIRQEDRIARDWAVPLIEAHMTVEGTKVLDIRCRSGCLAEALSQKGAIVTAIDPLEPNAEHARSRGTIAEVRFVPILDFFRLEDCGFAGFDAVTALTIHTLGHLPSPRAFLDGVRQVLKPGGLLFLDEKDIFHPVNTTGPTLFDTGTAHFFHFSTETVRLILEAAGFEVVECGLDPVRRKAFRHIRTVARRPLEDRPRAANAIGALCDAGERLARLARAQSRLDRRVTYNRLRRKTKAAIRRLIH
jgi:SAM-dependent methyltransferase